MERTLGSGAMGTVFRAYDSTRNATVALKVLRRVDPVSLLRFKTEFRSLATLSHPNLLQLFDFAQRGDDYLLSMELVEGGDFFSFVRSLGAADIQVANDGATETMAGAPTQGPSTPANDNQPAKRVARLDERKLRHALRQLAEGLKALHDSGHLHRDLKPANVLVFDADERLVICDFGLIVESTVRARPARGTAQARAHEDASASVTSSSTGTGEIAGTLAFMSPEQAAGGTLAPATDYYALGAMLYQALTLRVPFDPSLPWAEAVRAKHEQLPDHPLTIAADAPPDLADLAMALLHPDPARRAGYKQVKAVLEGASDSLPPVALASDFLVGRDAELRQLQQAYARTCAGQAGVALVAGRSGMGKSAIVQHFLADCEQAGALLLRGRCYECEDLPYKAFDPLMDALSSHLVTLTEPQVEALVPEDVSALLELFPVLGRVPAIVARGVGAGTPDPFERKRRAIQACRQLLRALARTRPLVLYVDDLQWGDLDSGPLFLELVRGQDAPGLLLLFAFREEDEASSALIRALRERYLPALEADVLTEVRVGPLAAQHAEQLAQALLTGTAAAKHVAKMVASETGGSPFFIREMVSFVRAHGIESVFGLTLETVLESRISALPAHSKTLLELVSVSGRPEAQHVLFEASGLAQHAFSAGQILKAHNLVQSSGGASDARIEAYHDRIRETTYRAIPAERRRHLHRLLAVSLESAAERAESDRDAEALFEHWRKAGENKRATEYALLAAQKAEATLAFLHAAKLYRGAVELLEEAAPQRSELEGRAGHALMFAGHGVDAADAFFRAMKGADEEAAQEYRRLAINQLLSAGQLARAFEELKNAEDVLGLKFPETNGKAIGMLLWRRLRTRLNDAALAKHGGDKAPKELAPRLSNLYRVATALSTVDFLRGGVYTSELTLRALKHGHPYHLCSALSIESVRSAGPNKNPAQTQWCIDRGMELARKSGVDYLVAINTGTAGVSRYLEGRFEEAVRLTRESQRIHREQLNATLAWDIVTMIFFEVHALSQLGRVSDIVTRVPEAVRHAETRGDLYASTILRIGRQCWAWLAPDRPELARQQLEIAEKQWLQEPYQLTHYYMLQAAGEIALYQGRSAELWERALRERKLMSLVGKIQVPRMQNAYLIGRLALDIARSTQDPRLLPEATSYAKSLQKESALWARTLGRLMAAGVASFASKAAALELLSGLPAEMERFDLQLFAAVTRYRTGQLVGGSEGAQLLTDAQRVMRALGVSKPAAFVRMLAPGFPD